MDIKKIITVYQKMQENGCVIYGAGKEGQWAIETLEKEKIKIWAISDVKVKKVMWYICISMDKLKKHKKTLYVS